MPWRDACGLGDRQGPDDVLERAREQLDDMVALLTAEQKLQIDGLVISAWIPTWFYAAQWIGRALETDAAARDALPSGFEALARS